MAKQGARMKRQPGVAVWMGAAFLVTLVSGAVVIGIEGARPQGIVAALRVTARLSYLLFWPAYAGSAMAALLGPRFKPLARRGREFGLAFAAAFLVHVVLIACLVRATGHSPLSKELFAFFGLGIAWIYLLAVFSIRRLADALGPTGWKALRTIGLEYIALAFFADFVLIPGENVLRHPLEYVPFILLMALGTGMRLAAWTRRVMPTRRVAT
jgi:hypothetical protein